MASTGGERPVRADRSSGEGEAQPDGGVDHREQGRAPGLQCGTPTAARAETV
ncbi:hypothetical protein [Streptomyces cyaneofuscatus]|uniref:hypothetical protein n=1 Tax=Streptomyces cyaneofuscatus TaxID=66883 RepID=UPI0037D09E38